MKPWTRFLTIFGIASILIGLVILASDARFYLEGFLQRGGYKKVIISTAIPTRTETIPLEVSNSRVTTTTEVDNIPSTQTIAVQPSAQPSPTITSRSRGYMTTPLELISIARKAEEGIQPYKDAVDALLEYAGEPDSWPKSFRSISGPQNCKETEQPSYIFGGSPLVYAKAMAYHITGDSAYAEEVRERILDLRDTYGFGGDIFSGANQCILNLSWYMPGWIMAADLIEDYPAWTPDDKYQFQEWLAREVYVKTAWSSRSRKNNWGSAGSATSAMIADYLWDTPILFNGETPGEAFLEHKQYQLDRMDTIERFDSRCDIWGIQWYGGIPDELRRGSSGCEAQWIVEQDASWTYTVTHIQGLVMHAELLLRRGDTSIYEHMSEDGSGSLLRAIHFIINNPVKPEKSVPWDKRANQVLEVTYRYYQDVPSAKQLGIGQPDRFIGGPNQQMFHFGTVTHGFNPSENPGLPPTVPPPGGE